MNKQENSLEKRRQAVIQYFISPSNTEMGFETFARNLLSTALGSGTRTAIHQQIEAQMHGLIDQLKGARQFNANYLGHMLTESSIPAMTAHMIATRLGSNTVAPEVSKLETKLEPEAIRFLLDIVGYDKEKASGSFTSGGSMAAFTALTVARKVIQEKYESKQKLMKGEEPKSSSSPDELFVLTTPMAHYSLHKSIDFLGGQNRGIKVVFVETEGLKMSPRDLEAKIIQCRQKGEVMAIYAIAGETETGLVDPLGQIAEIAKKHKVFTIADGAYGAPFRLSGKGQLFEDLNKFDAIVFDGHKALFTPYSNGAVLFKNAENHVLFGLGVTAPYIEPPKRKHKIDDRTALKNQLLYLDNNGNPIDFNNETNGDIISLSLGKKRPEGSAPAGSILSTVATKRTLGLDGLATVYDVTIDRINYLHDRLESSKWLKPIHKPDINVLCFTLTSEAEKALKFPKDEKKANAKRTKILEKVREELNRNEDGHLIEGSTGYFFSSTDLNLDEIDIIESKKQNKEVRKTHYVLRAVLMNPRTTKDILEDAVTKMEKSIENKIKKLKR